MTKIELLFLSMWLYFVLQACQFQIRLLATEKVLNDDILSDVRKSF